MTNCGHHGPHAANRDASEHAEDCAACCRIVVEKCRELRATLDADGCVCDAPGHHRFSCETQGRTLTGPVMMIVEKLTKERDALRADLAHRDLCARAELHAAGGVAQYDLGPCGCEATAGLNHAEAVYAQTRRECAEQDALREAACGAARALVKSQVFVGIAHDDATERSSGGDDSYYTESFAKIARDSGELLTDIPSILARLAAVGVTPEER